MCILQLDPTESMARCQFVHDLRQCPVAVGSPQTQPQRDQVTRVINRLMTQNRFLRRTLSDVSISEHLTSTSPSQLRSPRSTSPLKPKSPDGTSDSISSSPSPQKKHVELKLPPIHGSSQHGPHIDSPNAKRSNSVLPAAPSTPYSNLTTPHKSGKDTLSPLSSKAPFFSVEPSEFQQREPSSKSPGWSVPLSSSGSTEATTNQWSEATSDRSHDQEPDVQMDTELDSTVSVPSQDPAFAAPDGHSAMDVQGAAGAAEKIAPVKKASSSSSFMGSLRTSFRLG